MTMTALPLPAAPATPRCDRIEGELRRTMIAGLVTIAVAFGGFFGWACLAELESAAMAQGVVTVGSHRKTIQHLEGGILKDLMVREGDHVRAGQVLLRLDDTQPRALLDQLEAQYWTAVARAARLRAEQNEARELVFPDALSGESGRPEIAEIVATERRLFEARWKSFDGEIAVRRKSIEQLNEEVAALTAQLAATQERARLTADEQRSVAALLAKGYERKPRLLELQRTSADLKGQTGETQADLAKARQAISGAELEIIALENDRRTQIVTDLQTAQTQIADFGERRRAALDVLKRTEVVAPQDGYVVDVQFFTPGGVIGSGQKIMDLVPDGDELLIEAMVNPNDIDTVHTGLPAHVRLTAYKQRRVPMIDGEVVYVSADKLTDDRTGQPYFLARLRLDADSLGELVTVKPSPGMPAEVIIVTGARRAIHYFLSPLIDTTRRAFREE